MAAQASGRYVRSRRKETYEGSGDIRAFVTPISPVSASMLIEPMPIVNQSLDDVQHAWRQDVGAFGENAGQFGAQEDAYYGDCAVELLRHGLLLDFGAPCQLLSPAGLEHGRPIP